MWSLNWSVFKGIDCRELGLYMEEAPIITRPPRKDNTIEIDGRDGKLSRGKPTYSNYDKSAEYALMDFRRIDDVMGYLDGSGWITFSNEADKRYWVTVRDGIDWVRWIRMYGRIPVIYDTHPFKYEKNPEKHEFSAPVTIIPKGTYEALPVITVVGTGQGEVHIQNSVVKLSNLNGEVIIDSDKQLCHNGSENLDHIMSGPFPVINPKEPCELSFSGGIQRIIIAPNWRWL